MYYLKVRFALHMLERLWISSGGFSSRVGERNNSAFNRMLVHLRHSMLFFVTNLMYHLQVRVLVALKEALVITSIYSLCCRWM